LNIVVADHFLRILIFSE